MRQLLREDNKGVRIVGLGDAIRDLGTHEVCGYNVYYSKQMIYNILKGRSGSRRVLERIVKFRPDLLDLSFVAGSTIELAAEMGWVPRAKRKSPMMGTGTEAQ